MSFDAKRQHVQQHIWHAHAPIFMVEELEVFMMYPACGVACSNHPSVCFLQEPWSPKNTEPTLNFT